MSEHRDRIAIPNHTQETNINEYKEDGAIRGTSCRKDRTEPFHHILANEKYKCLYIGIQEKLSFFKDRCHGFTCIRKTKNRKN